jgi:hypothetical protein
METIPILETVTLVLALALVLVEMIRLRVVREMIKIGEIMWMVLVLEMTI